MRTIPRKKLAILAVSLVCFSVTVAFVAPAVYSRTVNIYEKLKVLNEVISIIDENYVEPVDWDGVLDGAFYGLLEKLDPHSAYIPREQLASINEQFHGKFEGIGIEFDILGGYITVISPVVGSPSDQVGLQPGDQIAKINGEDAFDITTEEVYQKLRGRRGTTVNLTIRRPGLNETFDVQITRDQIPIHSVTSAFMLDDKTAYIRLSRFSSTTSQEVQEAVGRLLSEGMSQLIFDLRYNSGGYLEQAVRVADHFITSEDTLVFTVGRKASSREVYMADPDQGHGNFALIILINRLSASASEIVAGAIQDLDRGLVVGETSFGKGLVQRQWKLRDDSGLRVTIARYYTPSGRLIQRPYDGGKQAYYHDLADTNREATLAAVQRPRYSTKSGREVYGGGGITPDIFISQQQLTESTTKVIRHAERFTFNWGMEFASSHRGEWASPEQFGKEFEVTDNLLSEFISYIRKRGTEFNESELNNDVDHLKTVLKAEITGAFWGRQAYWQTLRSGDRQVKEALAHFDEAKEFLAQGRIPELENIR